MNKKRLCIPVIVTAIVIGTLSYVGSQEAEAHQRITDLSFGTIIIGHDNEPSFGHEKGVWLGQHAMEVFLRDVNDDPIVDVEGLKVDKYYFKNVKKYNKANSLDDATSISLGNDLRQVFGESGTYHSDQIIAPGVYGYRVYGNISDGTDITNSPSNNNQSVDVTLFCAADGMNDPEKFEDADGGIPLREFTCPRDINDLKFPTDKKR